MKKIVRVPHRNECQIDLDSIEAYHQFHDRFHLLIWRLQMYRLPLPLLNVSRSKEPQHYHATVIWPKQLTTPERIALAAVLGSDGKRELMSLCRHFAGSKYPQLFFERKP